MKYHPMTYAVIFVMAVHLLLTAIDGCKVFRANRARDAGGEAVRPEPPHPNAGAVRRAAHSNATP